MRTQDAKRIPLRDLLKRLGYEPVSEKSGDIWYLSPFRQETKPSFHIKEAQNVYYDFGLSQGGNILDFVMRYYQLHDVGSALRQLDGLYKGQIVTTAPITHTPSMPVQKSKACDGQERMQTQKIQPLQHWGLLDYVKKRGIDTAIARTHLQEIYYTVRPNQEKPYFALAFPNRTANGREGYELRNAYIKGCIGVKDLSLIQPSRENAEICPHPSRSVSLRSPCERSDLTPLAGEGKVAFAAKPVCVFEGFMDWLSWLTLCEKRQPDTSVIVLNGVGMGERAIKLVQEMGAAAVQLYLDHDAPGRELTARFQRELNGVQVVDASGLYAGYEDMNAYVQQQRQMALAL